MSACLSVEAASELTERGGIMFTLAALLKAQKDGGYDEVLDLRIFFLCQTLRKEEETVALTLIQKNRKKREKKSGQEFQSDHL